MRMKKNKKAGIRLVWWKEARATEKQCYDTSLAVGCFPLGAVRFIKV